MSETTLVSLNAENTISATPKQEKLALSPVAEAMKTKIVDNSLHRKDTLLVPLEPWEEECLKEGMSATTSIQQIESMISSRFNSTTCQPPAHRTQNIPPDASTAGTTIGHTFWRCKHVDQEYIKGKAVEFLDQHPVQLQNTRQDVVEEKKDKDDDDDDDVPPLSDPSTKLSLLEASQGSECDICRVVEMAHHLDLTIAFVGDSVHAQIFQGLVMELQQRNYNLQITGSVIRTYKRRLIHYNETLTVRSPEWKPRESVIKIKFFTLYMVPLESPDEMNMLSQAAHIYILGFGLHYNSITTKKHNEGYALPSNYVEGMSQFLKALGPQKLLLQREASAQHFDAPNGGYAPWTHDSEAEQQHCKAMNDTTSGRVNNFRESSFQLGVLQAGFEYLDSGALSSAPAASRHNNHQVILLPFFDFTAQLHDLHPRRLPYDHALDCTHYCPSPYLYNPLWRSLRLAMDWKFVGS